MSLVILVSVATSRAQSAEEIIGKYVEAIGGQDLLAKITSLYMETTMDVMGMEGVSKTTILNGKGMLQETEMMNTLSTTCYTSKGGWTVNPMAGITTPESMPESQYESGKSQIYIGGPFIKGSSEGYQFELVGRETIGGKSAYRIRMTQPGGMTSSYLFDPDTYYLIQSNMEIESQGQSMALEITYSDYRKTELGYVMPFVTDINVDNQISLSSVVDRVEFNKPVDMKIFSMPE